jgi:hypothetical protein
MRFNYAPGLSAADFKEGGKLRPADTIYGRKELVPVTEGCSMVLSVDDPNDNDEQKEFTVGPADLKRGLKVMAEKYPKHFRDIIEENDDANTADIFLQCVIFGEEVYS